MFASFFVFGEEYKMSRIKKLEAFQNLQNL